MIFLFFLFLHSALSYTLSKIPPTHTPPNLFYSCGAAYDPVSNSLLAFGGWNEVESKYMNTLVSFSLSTLQWETIFPKSLYVPPPLCAPVLFLRSDRMLLSFFGISSNGYISDLLLFNLTSESWTVAPMVKLVPARAHPTYTDLQLKGVEYLAVFGGFTENGISNDLYL